MIKNQVSLQDQGQIDVQLHFYNLNTLLYENKINLN